MARWPWVSRKRLADAERLLRIRAQTVTFYKNLAEARGRRLTVLEVRQAEKGAEALTRAGIPTKGVVAT